MRLINKKRTFNNIIIRFKEMKILQFNFKCHHSLKKI